MTAIRELITAAEEALEVIDMQDRELGNHDSENMARLKAAIRKAKRESEKQTVMARIERSHRIRMNNSASTGVNPISVHRACDDGKDRGFSSGNAKGEGVIAVYPQGFFAKQAADNITIFLRSLADNLGVSIAVDFQAIESFVDLNRGEGCFVFKVCPKTMKKESGMRSNEPLSTGKV